MVSSVKSKPAFHNLTASFPIDLAPLNKLRRNAFLYCLISSENASRAKKHFQAQLAPLKGNTLAEKRSPLPQVKSAKRYTNSQKT